MQLVELIRALHHAGRDLWLRLVVLQALALDGRVRRAHRRRVALLYHVGQLVGQQLMTGAAAGRILALSKEHIRPGGKGLGLNGLVELVRLGIGVHLHAAEVRADAVLHHAPRGVGQGRAAPAGRAQAVLKIGAGFKAAERVLGRGWPLRLERVYGLANKGAVRVGFDADWVVFDPRAEYVVRAADQYLPVGFTIFEGQTFAGRPSLTISRGRVIVDHGHFVGQRGGGRFVARQLS